MSDPSAPALPVPAFTPVPVKTRAGWTPAKQRLFIETLAATGSVRLSCKAVGMTGTWVYKLRHRPGGESFARAWDEAVALGAQRVRDVLIDQAIYGIPERVLVGKDKVIERRRFNHRTMIWVLQHHMPDQYPGGSTTHRGGWREERNPKLWDGTRNITLAERAQLEEEAAQIILAKQQADAEIAAERALQAERERAGGAFEWTPYEAADAARD